MPYNFTAEAVITRPVQPNVTERVYALVPDRNDCEIRFPRVVGYRVELPNTIVHAKFDEASTLTLTPETVRRAVTQSQEMVGEGVHLNAEVLADVRFESIVHALTEHLIKSRWTNAYGASRNYLLGELKEITEYWLQNHLVCKGNTFAAQLLYPELRNTACERIASGIVDRHPAKHKVQVIIDSAMPEGSTSEVDFTTAKKHLWTTDSRLCHINKVVCDSQKERAFCQVVESHPNVRAYVKNQGLGFEVPYRDGTRTPRYLPDFIVMVDDSAGEDSSLHLIIQLNGFRNRTAGDTRSTVAEDWLTSVNQLGKFGRWDFVELRDENTLSEDFDYIVRAKINEWKIAQGTFTSDDALDWIIKGRGREPHVEPIPRRRGEITR